MLLFICAREALRTFRRLDGPEPLVVAGLKPTTFGQRACRLSSQEHHLMPHFHSPLVTHQQAFDHTINP